PLHPAQPHPGPGPADRTPGPGRRPHPGRARLGRHDRLRLGAQARAPHQAPDHPQHRCLPAAAGQAPALAAEAVPRLRRRRVGGARLQRLRRRRGEAGGGAAVGAGRARCPGGALRQLGQPPRRRPLRAGHSAGPGRPGLGSGRGSRQAPARLRRPPGLPRLGPARFRLRPPLPQGLRPGAAQGPAAGLRGRRPLRAGRQARAPGAAHPRFPRPQPHLRRSRRSQQPMNRPCNIAAVLPGLAADAPERIAMRCPGRRGRDGFASYDLALSYGELDRRSDAIAAGLAKLGIVRGTRTVVMVRPSPAFFLLMFALFKAGAVPVLVDPGIDKRALKQCLDEAEPHAFIGIPLAMAARTLLGWARSARILVTVGRRLFWGGHTLAAAEAAGAGAGPQLADTAPDDIAAILFTSGSTGVPKGVVYRHRHFIAQIDMLRNAFDLQPGGVDLPTFPPFALFDPALGLSSIIPDMDPTRPAQADPRKLHHALQRFGVDQLFGSPALMRVLANHGQPLPGLRRVTSAGAPVPADVVARMRELLPEEAQFWTPYGATECLPVA